MDGGLRSGADRSRSSPGVARHDRQAVNQRRRSDEEFGLRECVALLATDFDQQPPTNHNIFGDRQDAPIEQRANLDGEPILEFRPTRSVFDTFDPEPNLRQGDQTDEQSIQRLGVHKRCDH
jgi:hypothetical protein